MIIFNRMINTGINHFWYTIKPSKCQKKIYALLCTFYLKLPKHKTGNIPSKEDPIPEEKLLSIQKVDPRKRHK